MTEDGEDAHGNAAEERNQILQLQSEQFRKTEQLQRLKERCRALQEELDSREAELGEVRLRCDAERHGAKRAPGEDRARAALAEDHYLRSQVIRILQDRVPAMAPVEEEGEEEADQLEKSTGPKQEDTKTVHDTVLVSYVQSQDGRQDDYKVSYRIDSHTTVEQLHRDACAYWGCSRKDYSLWKIDSEDKPVALFKSPKPGVPVPPKLVQDTDVLNPAEAAHLHLCRDVDDIRKAKQKEKERDRERKEQLKDGKAAAEAQGERMTMDAARPHHFLKTLKRGLGVATVDKQPEEFVNALRPWPGIYHLLNSRSRASHDKHKWRPVAFSDIVAIFFLILLSGLCIYHRDTVDMFLLRHGVLVTLIHGIPHQTRDTQFIRFLTQATGLPTNVSGFQALTPGIQVLNPGAVSTLGGLRSNASEPGPQVARSFLALPLGVRSISLSGMWVPPTGGCPVWTVMLARGEGQPAADAPRVSASWSCLNTSLVGPEGLHATSSNCTQLGTLGGRLDVSVRPEGTVSIDIADDPSCVLQLTNGTLADFSLGMPLYAWIVTEGGGEVQNIRIETGIPANGVDFRHTRSMEDARRWMRGPFLYQLTEPSSTLNQHYELASPVRLRQKMTKTRVCSRQKLPLDLKKDCGYALISPETEDRATLPPLLGPLPEGARDWQPSPPGSAGLHGRIQQYYSGSGYVYDVPAAALLGNRSQQVATTMMYALGPWLNVHTRLFSIEMLFANKDLGGHVVAHLAIEMSASGAMQPTFDLLPVRLAPSYETDVAHGLDIARWVLVLASIMGWRIYRETKRQVLIGYSGLAYVFSLEGFLDASIAATFLAIQFMRLNGQPKLPVVGGPFRSYSQAAKDQQNLLRLEAFFLLLLIVRIVSFARMSSPVFRLFRAFGRSVRMFALYLAMFLPVFLSTTFLGTAIYGPYVMGFSNFLDSFVTMVFAMEESRGSEFLLSKSSWTIPFIAYFFLSTLAFFVHGFLAITVHSYFEVQLVDGSEPNADKWSRDEWLQWMLWRPVYAWAVNSKAGAKGRGAEESEAEVDEEESSSDEEEHDGKPH